MTSSVTFVSTALLAHQARLKAEKEKALKVAEAKARDDAKKIATMRRPSSEADRKVERCLISLAVTRDDAQSRKILSSVKEVPIENNEILDELVDKLPTKPIVGDQYLILVDGSRYGIQIIDDDCNKTCFYQHFLHYEHERLNRVNYRQVVIFWQK